MRQHQAPALADVLQALLAQIQQLHMQQTVHSAAYVALAWHLERRGNVDAQVLADDLRMLADTQAEPGWLPGLQELAVLLGDARGRP